MITSKVKYIGDLRTQNTHLRSGSEIITDAPVDNCGKGEAFSPTDLLATSLADCILTIIGIKAKESGFSIDGATAEVTKVMGTEPRRVVEITINFDFSMLEFTPKQKAIIKALPNACPVAHSLHPDIKQVHNFIF